ncbi:DUF3300 domain-containing protein, partial [Rhizobium sp. Root1220]|uniref:DUF3300 domain-containing protein n=1 Tax=Rhizobium sp. Root1220 TaxID=1736432 RepID=UPI001FCDD672
KNVIKTDDKVTVVVENENVVIRPTDPEKVYIPQYPPEMLYQPGYVAEPISYYPNHYDSYYYPGAAFFAGEMLYQPGYVAEPISYYPNHYDSYYYPGAAFFAGAVTGVAWAAIVNWDDWGVWGGGWGNDLDIDCNNCFNDRNFNGKVKWNDVDWSKVDRSKLSIGKDQLAKLDRSAIKSGLQSDNRNQLKNKVSDRQANRGPGSRDVGVRANDIRKGTVEGLKANPRTGAGIAAANRPGASRPDARPDRAANRPANAANRPSKPAANVNRKAAASKMAARADNRPRQPSALGNMQSGRREAVASQRGGHSMGGGQRGAPRAAQHRSRPMPHGGGGGRGGGRGGGGGRR